MDTIILDPVQWFVDRELSYTPKHFVITRARLTDESKKWIIENLKGRYSFVETNAEDDWAFISFDINSVPAFEDPQEAILYELKFSN